MTVRHSRPSHANGLVRGPIGPLHPEGRFRRDSFSRDSEDRRGETALLPDISAHISPSGVASRRGSKPRLADKLPLPFAELFRRGEQFAENSGVHWLEEVIIDTRLLATPLFPVPRNTIAKEPGSSYAKRWQCAPRLDAPIGGLDSLESSPFATLSRGAFSASSLVTPIRADTSRDRLVPACNTDLSLPTPPHTTSGQERMSPCPLANPLL